MDETDLLGFEALGLLLASPAGSLDTSWRWRQRCRALRLRFGIVSSRQASTSSSGSSVWRRNSTAITSLAGLRTVLFGVFGLGALALVERVLHSSTVLGLRP
jgi:hypothetical protein